MIETTLQQGIYEHAEQLVVSKYTTRTHRAHTQANTLTYIHPRTHTFFTLKTYARLVDYDL